MAYADKLVFYLLPFCLKLHGVRKRLPAASAANSEMRAQRLKPVRRRLDNPLNASLHVVLLPFEDLDVNHVSGNGKVHEYHHPVNMSKGLALSSDTFYQNILQEEINLFP